MDTKRIVLIFTLFTLGFGGWRLSELTEEPTPLTQNQQINVVSHSLSWAAFWTIFGGYLDSYASNSKKSNTKNDAIDETKD
jgi:hypothetical protein